jgi:hypothetical protein
MDKPFNPLHKEKPMKPHDLWVWVDFFCERYGWTVEEALELPIPTFYALQEAISHRNEQERKAIKKK